MSDRKQHRRHLVCCAAATLLAAPAFTGEVAAANLFWVGEAQAAGEAESSAGAVSERVIGIVAEHLGVDSSKITPDARLADDLGADSLDCVELIMTIEEEFDIAIPDNDAETFVSVQDVTRYVTSHQR